MNTFLDTEVNFFPLLNPLENGSGSYITRMLEDVIQSCVCFFLADLNATVCRCCRTVSCWRTVSWWSWWREPGSCATSSSLLTFCSAPSWRNRLEGKENIFSLKKQRNFTALHPNIDTDNIGQLLEMGSWLSRYFSDQYKLFFTVTHFKALDLNPTGSTQLTLQRKNSSCPGKSELKGWV